jgi:hypothetical protein
MTEESVGQVSIRNRVAEGRSARLCPRRDAAQIHTYPHA